MKAMFVGVAPQDAQTVQAIVTLKAETEATLALIGTQPIPVQRIDALQSAVDVQAAYETGKKKNVIAAEQWRLMASTDKHLLGGLLARWKSGVPLSPTFVRINRKQIAAAFDSIATLEGAKRK